MQGKIDVKVFFGIAIIIAGVVLFMDDSLGFDFHINIFDFLPLILIAIGLNQIVQPKEWRQSFSGWIFVGIGTLFLLDNLHFIYFNFTDLWPILLILIGFSILRSHTGRNQEEEDGPDFINLSFILGGGDHIFTSQKITGGKITAIMGGGKIDLRQASSDKEEIIIDCFAMWGGIEIVVPYHWQVNIKGTPVLGGMENKTSSPANIEGIEINLPVKKLIIKGSAIMGGVEVKNLPYDRY